MKSKIFTVLMWTLFSLETACAQKLNKAKMDSLFDVLAQKNKAMGSISIRKNGAVIYNRSIGYCQISEKGNKAANVDTKYRIGSITKMFTASMTFQLVEEGKLTLTTTLDTYFPQLPNAKLITVGNLLNHRSGLHNFTDDPDFTIWRTKPKTREEILAIIAKNEVDFAPNEKAEYSNSNYVVLGYIIEKVTKLSYAKNLQSRITSKIGLTNTYAGGKTNPDNNECNSYEYMGNWVPKPETDMSIPAGAGCIVSTPIDLTRFIEALFGLKLISKNSLLQMKTITDDFGMGMFQYPFNKKKAYGHTGGIDGFGSMLLFFPEDSLAIAYTGNGQVYLINDIMIGALSIYYNEPYKIPAFNTSAITLNTEDLDKYLGVYASTKLPLKITITKDNSTLIAQATGQSSFPLEAMGNDQFRFDQAGIEMLFNPGKNEMTMKQGGETFPFTKEK